MIVDHRGRPIRAADKRRLREEIAGPSLTEGRYTYSTRPARALTPKRLGEILRASETPGYGASQAYLELAEDMEEADLHYLGELQTRKRQLVQIGVIIEPATDSAEDVADAEFCRQFFERDTVVDELYDLLDAIAKGFSVAEIMWDTSEGQWMPQRLAWRLPQWFDFNYPNGDRLMLREISATGHETGGEPPGIGGGTGGWVELAPYKFVTHIVSSKAGLPIRGGLARVAAWAWMYKHYGLQDWARFCESYGQPLRLGKYPPNADPSDLAVLYRAVRMISTDAAAILPESMQIEFPDVSDVAGRSDIYKDFIGYIDNQVSIAVLGQTLTTQPGDSGSYSLGQVHNLVRHDIEQSDGRQLAATLRRDLVIPMVVLNRGERKAYPKVIIERVQPTDVKLLAESLNTLVPLGLRVKEDEVRTKLNLEEPDEDDVLLTPPAPPPAPPMPGQPPEMDTAMARAILALARDRRRGGPDEPIDAALTRDLEDWEPLMDPVVEPILSAAREVRDGGGSLGDFRDRLPALFSAMDDAAVVRLLHRLLFSAQVSTDADDA